MRSHLLVLMLVISVVGGPRTLAQLGMTVHADGHCDDLVCFCPAQCGDHGGDHAMMAMHGEATAAEHVGASHQDDHAAAATSLCVGGSNCEVRTQDYAVPGPAVKAVKAVTRVAAPAVASASRPLPASATPRQRATPPIAPPPRT